MDNRVSVVVVSGASSGIGNACATFLAKKGNKVYGACRNPSSYSQKADEFFTMLPMELTDWTSVAKVAERVYTAEGKVDALICCAGSGLVGAIEDSSIEEAQAVMDVNFFGTLRTIKAFLPRMREAGKGRILIVGALEGIAAVPYQGLYSASEFALEALAESLRLEVSAFGIDVGIIELGSFRTAFGQKRIITAGAAESSPYKKMLATALGVLSSNEASGLEPLIAARAIYAAITARRMRSRKTTGPFTQRFIAYCRRCFPARAFEHGLLKYFRLY